MYLFSNIGFCLFDPVNFLIEPKKIYLNSRPDYKHNEQNNIQVVLVEKIVESFQKLCLLFVYSGRFVLHLYFTDPNPELVHPEV